MKVGIVTMILPRMEVNHLKDWLAHLKSHKIDKVWIFCENGLVKDADFTNDFKEIWDKKPEADFNLALTHHESMNIIQRIANSSGIDVAVCPSPARSSNVGGRQHEVGNYLISNLASKDHTFDWICFLDVDEFLVTSTRSLKDILAKRSEDISRVYIRQKVFESRWHLGKSRAVAELTKNYGLCSFNKKYFFRPAKIYKFGNVHLSRNAEGRGETMPPDVLRFHHFRGLPDSSVIHPQLRGMVLYYRLRERPPQPDDSSHLKFL